MDVRCGLATVLLALVGSGARADETCMSPYMPKITGQEEFVYVWTLGVEGWGDGSDKLVTIDVKPGSSHYGKVVNSTSVGGRHEAHHGGFTDDRRELWLSGLDTSYIFIFDVATDPAKPRLKRTITDFATTTGMVGPHGFYALPGRMLVPCLSNTKDKSGRTGLVEYSNEGRYIATHLMPTSEQSFGAQIENVADGYGYDARVLPRKNVMLSSSFTGWKNYMRPFGELTKDAEAMKHFGQTVVLWNLHTRQPRKVFQVPGAPLEVRWAWGPRHNYAFTATALGSKIWLVHEAESGDWKATEVAHVGPEGQGVLPVDISLSADDNLLFVDSFGDGKCRVYDVSNPLQPKLIHEQTIGRQVNMVSQSWDGKRLYFTTSLLANWDKTGADNDQFLKGYDWNGRELKPTFTVDFKEEKLGRPHIMRFGSASLYN
ncbi:MAG TPA: selenium-binding protein SBP56-related protein [Verrucomicrobiae bacterium]|jgi:selenium-binding protein 1|nr:selenium-binding protein SBP56-related protein [Verrucomicrobiae bacterium]